MHALFIVPSFLEALIYNLQLRLVFALQIFKFFLMLPVEVTLKLPQSRLTFGRHLILQRHLLLLHSKLLFFELQLLRQLSRELLEALLFLAQNEQLHV